MTLSTGGTGVGTSPKTMAHLEGFEPPTRVPKFGGEGSGHLSALVCQWSCLTGIRETFCGRDDGSQVRIPANDKKDALTPEPVKLRLHHIIGDAP